MTDLACAECNAPRQQCERCERPLANGHDEEACNTGECGCPIARRLCWRKWHPDDDCSLYSVYDPKYDGIHAQKYD